MPLIGCGSGCIPFLQLLLPSILDWSQHFPMHMTPRWVLRETERNATDLSRNRSELVTISVFPYVGIYDGFHIHSVWQRPTYFAKSEKYVRWSHFECTCSLRKDSDFSFTCRESWAWQHINSSSINYQIRNVDFHSHSRIIFRMFWKIRMHCLCVWVYVTDK